ncbi:hypothetical protein [Streptococcus devriesei]|uniref:hypothetical protein n=1 Tax=Streptococcus devriesei TaxID=231233 RepID=UPI003CCC329B
MDITEENYHKKYKNYIQETSSYFAYNKESSEKNHQIKGRKLTKDNHKFPQ